MRREQETSAHTGAEGAECWLPGRRALMSMMGEGHGVVGEGHDGHALEVVMA